MLGNKKDRILSEVFPGQVGGYTEEQVRLVEVAIAAANRDALRSRIPRRDVRLGERFMVRDVEYECIRRPSGLSVSEACAGCAFLHQSCPAARCSRWDREDGNNVWFREVDG